MSKPGKKRATPRPAPQRSGRATRNPAVNAQTRKVLRSHYAAKYRVN
jgi:hypothetical protein